MNRFFLISLCCLLFVGCKRKGNVSGKVINAIDGSSVEGVEVRITYTADKLFNKNEAKSIQLTTTDSEGNYLINAVYNTKINYDYYVSLNPNDSYVKDNQFFVKDTSSFISKSYYYQASQYTAILQDIKPIKKTKSGQNFDLKAATCARLKIIAKNVAPANESDKIEVTLIDKNLKDGGVVIFSNKVLETPVVGNYSLIPTAGSVSLKWSVTELNSTKIFYDTIAVQPHSKTVFYINY